VAEVIVVTSGKGGVGKTTTSASLAYGLALKGYKTAVIDFDVGLRNLDLIMGVERRVVYDLVNVLQEEATLKQALIRDKTCDNLYILAASQTRDKDVLTLEGVARVIDDLKLEFDYIVCDSPAGIEKGALMAMHYADTAFIVTNPEVSSVRDSDRILGMLGSKTKRAIDGEEAIKEHLVVTRYADKRVNSGEMLSIDDITELLGVKLLGIVPECGGVLTSSNAGTPVIRDVTSEAGKAYTRIVARFLGENVPSYEDQKQKGFFRRIFSKDKESVA
jgi:septum site-determining protein MinD